MHSCKQIPEFGNYQGHLLYLFSMLAVHHFFTKHLKQTLVCLNRVYSDEARHDLELLKTTWLIDEFNQSLKSVVNYREALAHLLNEAPELEDYLKKFLVVLTGDFPTWKYNKKIIAEVCYALNHIQIPTTKTRQNWSPKKETSFKDLSESDYYLVKGSGRKESGIIF